MESYQGDLTNRTKIEEYEEEYTYIYNVSVGSPVGGCLHHR